METFSYKVEISGDTAVINRMFTNGELINAVEVNIDKAKKFISQKGLAFMYDDGEAKYYW